MTHPPGAIVYARFVVVGSDPESPWGDRLRCVAIGQDRKPDHAGGVYGIKPEHVVPASEVEKAVKKAAEAMR